jgi:uracil-DNA glycosylase family 4
LALFDTPKAVIRPVEQRAGCEACALASQWPRLHTPRMPPDGARRADVYFIGAAPSTHDDENEQPFSGDGGLLLRTALKRWERRDDAPAWRLGNVARCRPPDRPPSPSEIYSCWTAHGLPDVAQVQPRVVVPLGNVALNRFVDGQMAEWDRVRFPVVVAGRPTWVYPLQHPSYLLEQDDDSDLRKLWNAAITTLGGSGNWPDPVCVSHEDALAGIHVLYPSDLAQFRDTGVVLAARTLGVDLETTTLIPQEVGSKILSCSVSNGDKTLAWLVGHPNNPDEEFALWCIEQTLERATRLIAHNTVFEQRHLAYYFGHKVFKWNWCDTMARPYAELGVLQGRRDDDDNPGKLAALGKQTQVAFGFNVKHVLDVDPTKWQNYPVERFLQYNGLDAKWCYKLWHHPLPDFARVEVERQRGATRLAAAISWKGMLVDQTELTNQTSKLEADIKADTQKIMMAADVVRYERDNRARFNPGAPDQVAKFFGLASADEDALRTVDTPLAKQILRLRKMEKLHGTYAKGIYKALYPDGYLHPDYSTMRTVTGRWSTRKPNTTNVPVREDKTLRRNFIPPKGYAFVSFDYKQLEGCGVVMATGDRAMLDYIWRGADMHKEWAIEVLDAYPAIADRLCPTLADRQDEKKVIARVRGEMKNTFTFPLIYGASVRRCSREMQVPEDKLGPVIDKFWSKFAGIANWQRRSHEFYYDHWYVETLTQRRRFAPVSWNEQLNTPVQGTGSDIVVDGGVRTLDRALATDDPHLIPIINIHDDLSFYFPVTELQGYIETVARIMVTPTWDFISVPLTVEVKVGLHNWSEQNEFGTYTTGTFYPLPPSGLDAQVGAIRAIAARRGRDPVQQREPSCAPEHPARGVNDARRARTPLLPPP